MKPDRILETCLYVTDLDAARAFYMDILGLEFVMQEAGRHVFLRCGDSMFLLFNPEQTPIVTGFAPPHGALGPGHVAFAMREADIPAWRERLQTAGVAIETEFEWPHGGYSIYFRDPAGNSVELATPRLWGLE